MRIDVPTLLLTLVIGFLLLSLQLWVAQRGALRQPELRIWAQGSLATLAGFGMLFLRPWLNGGFSILIGNTCFLFSVALYSKAIYRHLLDRGLPRWYWPAIGLSVLGLAVMMDWDAARRTTVVSLTLSVLLLPATRLSLAHGWRGREGAMRNVGVLIALAALALVVRGVDASLHPDGYRDALRGQLVPGLTFLLSFLCPLGAGFGFVLACFERVALRMEEMATTDGLTGCMNRVTTDAILAHSLERGRREGSPVAFCLLDIDHFKQVNDNHGHQAGDMVLRHFAATVRGRLRASDVIGRMGGEEFGLVLPATDAPGALRLAEQVRAAVEQMVLHDDQGRSISLTVSAGVVVAASDSGLTATRLYMLADGALYRAKHGGRNRVQLVEETADAALRSVQTVENPPLRAAAGS